MRVVQSVLTGLILAVASPLASADWVETFSDGTTEQNWLFGSIPDGSSFDQSVSNNELLLESTTPVGSGGAAAAYGLVFDDNFDGPGVSVRSALNPNGIQLNDNIGVLGNIGTDPDTFNFNGYALTIGYGGSGDIDLSRIEDGAVTGLDSVAINDFEATNSYTVELNAVGSQLTGFLLDEDDNVLHTLSATDESPWTSGIAGVVADRAVGDTSDLRGAVGTTSATSVPEASSLAALGLFAVPAWVLCRRRMSVSR